VQKEVQTRGVRAWKYGMHEIADAAGVPYRTAKEHRLSGRLHPEDLVSVGCYIASYRLKTLSAIVGESDVD